MRLFPELFARHRVAPVENYPDQLLATLQSVAPDDASARADRRAADARRLQLGLLRALASSPTRWASNWSRAAIWSSRTRSSTCARPQGLKRVDVIYRRIDDDFLDPLTFRPDSRARRARADGRLPGRQRDAGQRGRHRHRRRQGGLHLHAGDHQILSRRGADPEERADLALPRARASRLRARPSRRAGGQGGARLRRLRHADRPEIASKATIEAFRAKLKAEPENFIAQPTLALSTCPTCVEEGVAPRHVDLRPFVLTGSDRIRIVPGGLTRVALKRGLAGGQFEPGRRHQGHLGAGR